MRPAPPRSLDEERRKRRRELVIAFGSAVLIGIIFFVEYRIARDAENLPFSSHLLLFTLLSVVTLLLILVIFFLIRNLSKLVFERRQGVLGSHLKTRLMLAFVALTLVPTIVLFVASAGVVYTTIESWFVARVDQSLQSSFEIAQAYYLQASDNTRHAAKQVAREIRDQNLLDSSKRMELHGFLRSKRALYKLSSLQVYFDWFQWAEDAVAANQTVELGDESPAPRRSLLRIAFKGNTGTTIVPLENGADIVRAVVPIAGEDGSAVKAALVADVYVPSSPARKLFAISNAYNDYREAKRMKGPVQSIYMLILLMVALLVILIGSWFGLTMARDITEPIQRLANGTARIAAGDLDVYIEPMADDELGQLVRSFNQMTQDLRVSTNELVRVNLDLDNRRRYIETILRSIAAGVMAIGPDGCITAMNSSAMRLLGVDEIDIRGKRPENVLPQESRRALDDLVQQLATSGIDTIEHNMNLALSDRHYSLMCFANTLRDDEGNDIGMVLVFEDMTQLVKAQRMAAWRDVARRIAHEIKNPLTPIKLNAQRILRKYRHVISEDGAILDQCTKAIIEQVDQLREMVNEFSHFARMPSVNPMPGDLNAVLRDAVDFFAQGSDNITFRFDPATNLPTVSIDGEQIRRAIVNLLDNAASVVGQDGEIDIRTAFDEELGMVTIEVRDNGPGVDPHDRHRLFEPYFSRKPGGTGLGLTIVSTIVADHDGFVRFKDRDGPGAVFVIELPVRSGMNADATGSDVEERGNPPRTRRHDNS